MNKHIFWVVPVGVAAGLSLPLVVPVRKVPVPPRPRPAVPVVTVDAFELKPKAPPRVALPTVEGIMDSNGGFGSLASAPIPISTINETPRTHRHRVRRMDPKVLRRIQNEDSRAFQAADRLLQYERRGA